MADGNVVTKRKLSEHERNGETTMDSDIVMRKRLQEKVEREQIVLWRQPLTTLLYFQREMFILIQEFGVKLWHHKPIVLLCLLLMVLSLVGYHSKGPHQKYLQEFNTKFLWCAWWVGLGVLSSIGLGTGLHTFILKLGPHIAKVTLAAYECGSLDFPEPPYPDEIICPEVVIATLVPITIWEIMNKVRLEACMWGTGTALGELPPYFMARAARLSVYDPDEQDLEDYERRLNPTDPNEQSYLDRAKIMVERLVERVGFFGILACASIPNPLFDLAGITCGHFLVPFWTFFGATLIGKAIIKTGIQKLFVIIAFNEEKLEKALSLINYIPYVGKYLQAPFREFLVKEKAKLHRKAGAPAAIQGSWISWIFEKFVVCMILYFLLSIVNSLAQSYHKRIHKRQRSVSQSKTATD